MFRRTVTFRPTLLGISEMVWKIAGCLLFVAAFQCPVPGAEPAPSGRARESATTDDDEKRRILESDQWRQVRLAFDEWLAVQKIYDAQQAAQLPSRLKQKVAGMSSRELQKFLEQMQAKMAILLSPAAADARDWLGHFVSARVVFSQDELDRFDVLTMTTSQMDAALRSVESKRAARGRSSHAHNQLRNEKVQQRQKELSRLQSRTPSRASTHGSGPAFQSQYAPRRPEPAPPPSPRFIVSPYGGVARML
jgi:hypothetical protein